MNKYRDILLCSEDTIKTYTNINDNTSGEYILPALYMAQRAELEETIGSRLVYKLQELVGTNSIDNPENIHYKELLDFYITDYLAYATIVRLIPVISFKLGNAGAVRTEDEKVYGISYNEVFNLRDFYQNQADYLKYRLQRFLIADYTYFPELVEYKTIADLQTNLYSAANVPIWLGGCRGTKTNYNKPTLKDKYNFPSSGNKKK